MASTQLAPLLAGGIGVLLGLIFIAIGWLRGKMVRGWTSTTGMIVNRDGSTTGMPALYPTFQWRDQHGLDHRHTSMVRASLGPRPGTAVEVLYDPGDPSRGIINSAVQSGRIFLVIGGVIAVVALGLAGFLYVVLSEFNS
jgi:uncharacterized protein DUF3592